MIDFASTTPFQLIRRVAAAGQGAPLVYLLICDTAAVEGIQADLAAEAEVQLGLDFRLIRASEVRPENLETAFKPSTAWLLVLFSLDHCTSKLIDALDRNVVLLTRAGSLLLLATHEIAERVLTAAPNLRNRLADVVAIGPDETFGDAKG